MAYINPNIFEEDFANLTGWTAIVTNGGVSEIDPAGQLHFDCSSMSANGRAGRKKDLGTIGSGDYYIEIRFKADTWDGYGAINYDHGLMGLQDGATKRMRSYIGNGFSSGDGIIVTAGENFNYVLNKTWDNNWHTIVFYVHNSQTDCDIWVDKDPATEAADVTDADCATNNLADGFAQFNGYGTVAGNGEYHIDYWYVGDALAGTANATFFGSNF